MTDVMERSTLRDAKPAFGAVALNPANRFTKDVSKKAATWMTEDDGDTFVSRSCSGESIIHDFDPDLDVVDLTHFGLSHTALADLFVDTGWATKIDLCRAGGQPEDCLILSAIDPAELDESNFIL
ncbi:hypothetical protein [Amylibacter sp. IMCC11727]|uniref:hypothetical protein n=1 Tax=Amylibacter sp. IMCC11727 TaxID=3039851 RepID=UPI00244DD41B|nr:hypothetical protein [Amylibacter sp. IMCC11727]WGI21790.1 hypothetical protein QBD29_17025 [Amylibacter sp. IMCC11727]